MESPIFAIPSLDPPPLFAAQMGHAILNAPILLHNSRRGLTFSAR